MNTMQDGKGNRIGVIVDAYSTGRFLASEFGAYGCSLVHVQSMANILPFDKPYFRPADFSENLIYEGCEEKTIARLKDIGPDFVIPGCESGVILADYLAEWLGLPGNGTSLSLARRNKDLMAGALAKAGLRTISHFTTDQAQEASAWRLRHGKAELVIKPVNSAGTEDVFFCHTDDEIENAVRTILGKTNSMGHRNETSLVQERIRGDQYTANVVSCSGSHYLAELWTYQTREVPGAGSICELEILLDGDCSIRSIIEPYVFSALDALGIRNGPTHVELFVDREGPVLIELGARMQGSMSRASTLSAVGHDHVSLTAMLYADPERFASYAKANDPYRRRKEAFIVSLLSDRDGTVSGLSGIDSLKKMKSFSDAISFPAIGDKLTKTRDLASTAGIIYLVHKDRDIVEQDYGVLKTKSIDQIIDLKSAS